MFKYLLIWRYLIRKRITSIAIVAVMLLVMLILVVLSVMSGLLQETRDRNHQWTGDIVISRDSLVGFPYYQEFIDSLVSCDLVDSATPMIKTFGLQNYDSEPLVIFGIRPIELCRVTDFAQTLHYQKDRKPLSLNLGDLYRDLPSDEFSEENKRRGVIWATHSIGRPQFDNNIEWDGHYFDEIILPLDITVFGVSSRGKLIGSAMGESQRFWYVDDSVSGLVDIDTSSRYVDFDELQNLCWMAGQDNRPPRANEIRIRLKEDVALSAGRLRVIKRWDDFVKTRQDAGQGDLLGDCTVQTWKQYRRSFIAPMEKEKSMMIMVFGMIAVVAAFIIFIIFYMIVTEKIKDFGIIKSVGASSWMVSQIFLGFGALVGTIGAILGTGLGCAIVMNSNRIEDFMFRCFEFRLWPPDMYAIDKIPDVVNVSEAAIIAGIAILVSMVGAALPALRAARLNVVEALRVE
ncbi:MAG: FtsX-like permease family protein [Phycisphaerae bacterium]|nr:FtsX-like permease family protein [Phycisphaerae bacterium]